MWILVSGSTTVFVAGRRTQTNILSDLVAAKTGALAMYHEVIYEPLFEFTCAIGAFDSDSQPHERKKHEPLWGKTLVDQTKA